MKNENVTTWLFTPFRFIAGGKSLLIGFCIILLLSILGYCSNVNFDGVIDIHIGKETPYSTHLVHLLSSWLILTITLFVAALICSKSKFRLIDLAGTLALSQAPLIIAALWGFIPYVQIDMGNIGVSNHNDLMVFLKDNIGVILLNSFVFIAVTIWSLVLKYNAYSVSINAKGIVAIASFSISIIISEFISILFFHFLMPIIL